MEGFVLKELHTTVYRTTIERPIQTAFGMMTDRPAVIVRAIAEDGTVGIGEIWCNFPQCGAEHRARLILTAIKPLVIGHPWSTPEELFKALSDRLHHLALQSGEPGPIAQAIAGVDIAVWDLLARRKGQPLWRMLGGDGNGRLPAYASGINPDGSVAQALRAKTEGYRRFKLKVGFGRERDAANLKSLRDHLGEDAEIMVDANQAWSLDEAKAMSDRLADYRPSWLEEPLPADSPIEDWQSLAANSPIPLAVGENLRGDAAFDKAIGSGAFRFIQPDVAKWGGISKGLPLVRRIEQAGLCYCPHFLGGGVGLLASAHLLAATGGEGLLEVDSNPNPLREGLAVPFPKVEDGDVILSEASGLGIDLATSIDRHVVFSSE